ncbi:unnamed protein product [Linum tenue]|uniref:Cellulose synthase-like protein G3 n=1 Tax=Linum tenue TaxID=586396 RepID=A0AAV0M5B6_9ROSI|nr:unnamed protein product [Linum tenue]
MEDDPTTRRRRSSALHTADRWPITPFNRLFAPIYLLAVLALLYRHVTNLLVPATSSPSSFTTTLALLVADLVLAFMWATTQVFRMNPIRRREAVENLNDVVAEEGELPGVDVFICTADPYKEPPLGVVNTALSVMAYDYPRDRLAVYVSDDGGSALTLFAFVEAAKFAARWLPFCERNRVVERNPAVYFGSNRGHPVDGEVEEIKTMYESMKHKVEHVVEAGKVDDQFIDGPKEQEAFGKWSDKFTKHNHPTFIQVLLDSKNDKDVDGHVMPNLIYVSREKSSTSQHHFKAGALNVLLRVSATMTNQPIVLTLDCDMYSNDPATPRRAMCYLCDPKLGPENSAFVQFPQKYHGINENDIYAGEFQRLFQAMPMGADGLCGPHHVGTGCFFRRRAFFGSPSSPVAPEIPEVGPDHVVGGSVRSGSVLELAHRVAECGYENQTSWGSKMGFRYGSMVEDLYTGFHLHCEGWRSIFCYPEQPSFLGDSPISFADVLIQQSRWSVGAFELSMSKKSPLFMGIRKLGWLMGLGYCHFSFWPIWSLPITTYAFLPQLALLNGVSVFPKVSDPWFLLYTFLFLGSYLQDMLEFTTVSNSTFRRWWNEQRIWTVRGLSCFLFGGFDFVLKSLGVSTKGFSLTSKVVDEEQRQRYEKGMFEFGVSSPIFLPMAMAALINLVSFGFGLGRVLTGGWWNVEGLVLQIVLSGFGVLNSVPIYEAMVVRRDPGKFPARGSFAAVVVSVVLCSLASVMFSF